MHDNHVYTNSGYFSCGSPCIWQVWHFLHISELRCWRIQLACLIDNVLHVHSEQGEVWNWSALCHHLEHASTRAFAFAAGSTTNSTMM